MSLVETDVTYNATNIPIVIKAIYGTFMTVCKKDSSLSITYLYINFKENESDFKYNRLQWSKKRVVFLGLNDGNKLGDFRLADRHDS